MAQFYIGNWDPDVGEDAVVQRLKVLDDAYYVFLNVKGLEGRECDVLVFRASAAPQEFSTMIATEVKHFDRVVRGTSDGHWEEDVAPDAWVPVLTSGRDTSPYWQAINTANATSRWLYNHQRLYREDGQILQEDAYRVWPDLLLLSPPGVNHQLPLSPTSRNGMWFVDPDEWVQHVLGWRPRLGTALTATEIQRIAEILHLDPFPVDFTDAGEPAGMSLENPLKEMIGLERQLEQVRRRFTILRTAIAALEVA